MEKIYVNIGNDRKLVVEINEFEKYKEIFVSVESKDIYQDIVLVRTDSDKEDKVSVLLWEDEFCEDYTSSKEINIYTDNE